MPAASNAFTGFLQAGQGMETFSARSRNKRCLSSSVNECAGAVSNSRFVMELPFQNDGWIGMNGITWSSQGSDPASRLQPERSEWKPGKVPCGTCGRSLSRQQRIQRGVEGCASPPEEVRIAG